MAVWRNLGEGKAIVATNGGVHAHVDVTRWEVMVRGPCPKEAAEALLDRVNANGFGVNYRDGKECRDACFNAGTLLLKSYNDASKHFTRYGFVHRRDGWNNFGAAFFRDTLVNVPVGGGTLAGFDGLLCPR
jgi:hypothetical protein